MKEKIPYIMPVFFVKESNDHKNEKEIYIIDYLNNE